MGKEYVGIDLQRRRSLIYRMDQAGERIDSVRVDNEPSQFAKAVSVARVGSDANAEATTGPTWRSPAKFSRSSTTAYDTARSAVSLTKTPRDARRPTGCVLVVRQGSHLRVAKPAKLLSPPGRGRRPSCRSISAKTCLSSRWRCARPGSCWAVPWVDQHCGLVAESVVRVPLDEYHAGFTDCEGTWL